MMRLRASAIARTESHRIPAAEYLANVGLTLVCLISYQQLAAPACDGRPHTLPEDSRLLAGYPSNGTSPQRLVYILRSAPMVLWDIFHLQPEELWVTHAALLILIRLVSTFVLPSRIYAQVVVPLSVYFGRLHLPIFHLLLGNNHQPSWLALRSLFRTLAGFEVAYFLSLLGMSRVNVCLELACCSWNAACLWILCYWYRDITPGGINITFQIVTRLLLPAVTLYLGRVAPGWRRTPDMVPGSEKQHGGGGAGRECKANYMPVSEVVDGAGSSRAADADGGCTAGLYQGGREVPAGSCASEPPQPLPPQPQSDSRSETTGPAATAIVASAAATAGAASAPVLQPADCLGAPGHGVLPRTPRPRLPPYHSFIQRHSVYYKIPWAEPEQLGPGYEGRLQELFAARGQRLAAVYVRRGCVELMLVVESTGGAAGEAPVLQPELAIRTVIQALGLIRLGAAEGEGVAPGRPPLRANSGDESALASLLAQVQVRVVEAEHEQDDCRGGGWTVDQGDQPPTPGRPHVISAWPRVLLLPQPQQRARGVTAEAGTACCPVALRVVVAWGPGSPLSKERQAATPGSGRVVHVLARACNAFLPVRIAAHSSSPGDTEGAVSCKYDIELLGLPTRPGTLLLELSCGPDGNDGGGGSAATAEPGLRRVLFPLLVTHDAGVAAEVVEAAADWPADSRGELDELLWDMGSWAAAVADGTAADGGGAGDSTASGDMASALGQHLLQYAQAAGWLATAQRIAADMRHEAGGDCSEAAEGAAQPAGDPHAGDVTAAAHIAARKHACGGDDGGGACSRSQSGSSGEGWSALSWVLLRMHGAPADEAASFRAMTDRWAVRMAEALQVLESLLLLTLLVRAAREGQPLLSAITGVAVAALGLSAVSLLAWLVLPYHDWAWLAARARLPRYCGYLLSKALVATAVVAAPPGVGPYAAGLGMLLQEGLILPGACLLSPRTATVVAALKLPLNVGVLLASGAVADPATAVLLAARVEVAALITTIAAHVYLRVRHDAGRKIAPEEKAAEAPAGTGGGRIMAVGRG